MRMSTLARSRARLRERPRHFAGTYPRGQHESNLVGKGRGDPSPFGTGVKPATRGVESRYSALQGFSNYDIPIRDVSRVLDVA